MDPSIKGIRNLKNTCYINSSLQLLSNIIPISTYLQEDNEFSHSSYCIFSILSELKSIYCQLFSSSSKTINPKVFISQCFQQFPQFPAYTQQDSEEFLMALIEKLDSELKSSPNLIKTTIEGCYSYKYTCKACNHASQNTDYFRELNLQIPQDVPNINTLDSLMSEVEISIIAKQRPSFFELFDLFSKEKARINLYYCLFSYLFNSNTQKFCAFCNEVKDHSSNISMVKFPEYLIISLKRFKYRYWNRKISENVFMPNLLDFSKLMENGAQYELQGVIEHTGFSFRGHYKAYILRSGEWWLCNDSKTRKCSFEEVFTSQAYISLYKLAS